MEQFLSIIRTNRSKKLVGKTLTLSFKTKEKTNNVELIWVCGLNSSNEEIYSVNQHFDDTERDFFSVTFKMKEDCEKKIEFGIQIHSKADTSVEILWAKLEIGDKFTPFIPKKYSEERTNCERFYQIKCIQPLQYI